jgi:hypothetical protein
MSSESQKLNHWTDERLIDYLYGACAEDDHLSACSKCRERLFAMRAARSCIEDTFDAGDDLGFRFLAAQRRNIYARVEKPARWWAVSLGWRWVSAAAVALVVSGGLVVVQQGPQWENPRHGEQRANVSASDAQLAEEVNQIASSAEQGQMVKIRQIVRSYRDRLFDASNTASKADAELKHILSEASVNSAAARPVIERLAEARANTTRLFTQMSVELRSVLTQDQWRQLVKRWSEVERTTRNRDMELAP